MLRLILNKNDQTGNDGTKDVEIMLCKLKYLSTVWRTLEIPLINCEINLILTWSTNYLIITYPIDNQDPTFIITDTKLYVPVITFPTQDNEKLLQQLKSGYKSAINWNKYKSKETIQAQNRYLDYPFDPSFQGVNRLFVLSIENDAYRTNYRRYFLSNV